jgi:ABC-2 type transport system permease protein
MSLARIKAILVQELFITRRSLEVVMDTIVFSAVSVVVFGLMSAFLAGRIGSVSGQYFLLGMLLWEIIRITQYTMSVGSLWNIWSRNLTNIFIAPISVGEYLLAQFLSSAVKSMALFVVTSFISYYLFDFNVLALGGLNLFFYFINLTLFAATLGIVLLGFVFWLGARIQALTWGVIFFFQPLCASFFPLSLLPAWLQKISLLFPATYVFEAARASLASPVVNWNYMLIALAENIVYLFVALWLFHWMFSRSKASGQFAKNEQ